jgi:hypothetical protein
MSVVNEPPQRPRYAAGMSVSLGACAVAFAGGDDGSTNHEATRAMKAIIAMTVSTVRLPLRL